MSTTTFENNFEILRKVNRELAKRVKGVRIPDSFEVRDSRIGSPVLRIGKISLHSTYDPIEEAERLIESQGLMADDRRPTTILVFGLGFGYHIRELLSSKSKVQDPKSIFIIEPSLEVFRCAIEHIDLRDILTETNLLIGKSPEDLFESSGLKLLLQQLAANDRELMTVIHQPSVKINEGYFEEMMRKAELQRFLSMVKLKILVVYPIYGGSLPIARYCTEALENLGHKVEVVDNSIYKEALDSIDGYTSDKTHTEQLRGLFISFLSEAAMAKCLAVKPDLVLALAQAPLNKEVLERFRQFGFPTALWFVEDFCYFDYWKEMAPYYDYFFTIQRGEFFDELERIGVKNYHYLPLAASSQVHRRVRLKKEEQKEFSSDISFVGAGYYNRQNLLPGLLDFDFKIWGDDWNLSSPLGRVVQRRGERITTEESVKIFCASKINLNLHSSSYHNGVNPNGDFVNPRTFEIASCGGFQLVDFRSGLPELFKLGEEMITFEDLEDLRSKIGYYLDHPQERRRIASRARRRVLRDHTYEVRMRDMLSFVYEREERVQGLRWKEEGRDKVGDLIEQAGTDTELKEFLSKFKDRDELSLKDVTEEIQKGEGELSQVEGVFLLMNELWDWAKEKKVI